MLSAPRRALGVMSSGGIVVAIPELSWRDGFTRSSELGARRHMLELARLVLTSQAWPVISASGGAGGRSTSMCTRLCSNGPSSAQWRSSSADLAGLEGRRRSPLLFSVRSSALGLATIVRPIIAIAAETLQSRSPFDKR